MPSPASTERLRYLDWTRGLAALIMLQGHVFHSFTRMELRGQGLYILSQFLGGLAPAIFLFLTGVTMAFRIDSDARRGLRPGARVLSALRRARYLPVIAFLFRLQMWVFSLPGSAWAGVMKVDILNCMALAGAVFSIMAVFRTLERVRLCAALGLAAAAASPLVSQLDWSGAPALIRNYIAPDYLYFSFFPWAALLGGGLIVGGRYFSEIPYSLYTKSEFWLDGPELTLIKLGVVLWILPFAFLWTRYADSTGWSAMRQ